MASPNSLRVRDEVVGMLAARNDVDQLATRADRMSSRGTTRTSSRSRDLTNTVSQRALESPTRVTGTEVTKTAARTDCATCR